METWVISLIGFGASLILTIVMGLIILPVMKKKKMEQPILECLPPEQQRKKGTPTMGGLFFLFPVVICIFLSLFFSDSAQMTKDIIATAVTSLLFGLIGVLDDTLKLRKKENEGLKAWQKLLCQLVVATAFIIVTTQSTALYIPFFKETLELGWLYYPLMILGICAIVNAVNLTDGVDGLATSVTSIVCLLFFALGLKHGTPVSSITSMIMFGGCIGFLFFNAYPAKVFMGDTGSLFLGGVCCMMAKYSGMSLLIVIVGFVYIFEMISDIIQIGSIKLRHGKKVFKMAPYHHHLEKSGWSERQIVLFSVGVTVVLGFVSYMFA